jgi:hypothetical protein
LCRFPAGVVFRAFTLFAGFPFDAAVGSDLRAGRYRLFNATGREFMRAVVWLAEWLA